MYGFVFMPSIKPIKAQIAHSESRAKGYSSKHLWLEEADTIPKTLNFINCMLGSYNKKL